MEITRKQHSYDLSWFLDQYATGRLNLTPDYQRFSVWSRKDRNDFLDTIFNNFPCPAIYLQKEITDSKIIYNVVDGKQRLQTILDFYDDKLRVSKNFAITELRGKNWKDISKNAEWRNKFFNYSLSVEQLNCEGDGQWDEVFNRVNKNSKVLKRQELRHARFNGWLIEEAENNAESDLWKKLKISTKGRSRRMQNIEFISILMLNILEEDFIGFPQDDLDKLYVKYNDFKTKNELSSKEEVVEDYSNELYTKIYIEQIEHFDICFDRTCSIISKIVESNTELLKHITNKAFTNVYSVWTLIAFNLDRFDKENEIEEFITKLLNMYIKITEIDEDIAKNENDDDLTEYSKQYIQFSSGAATEKGPRIERHKALMNILGWNT